MLSVPRWPEPELIQWAFQSMAGMSGGLRGLARSLPPGETEAAWGPTRFLFFFFNFTQGLIQE